MTGRSTPPSAATGRGAARRGRIPVVLAALVVAALIGWVAVVACRGPAGPGDVEAAAWTGSSCLAEPGGSASAATAPGAGPAAASATLAPTPSNAGAGAAGDALPDLVLSCFTGGKTRLSQLSGPVIVNLWASWCRPCRAELPAFQEFHARAAGAVSVVGVATQEVGRQGAESLIEDLALGFPMLWDPDGALLHGVGRSILPVTLFIGPDGRIAHLYSGPPLDAAGVEALAATHLGVRVTS